MGCIGTYRAMQGYMGVNRGTEGYVGVYRDARVHCLGPMASDAFKIG